MVMWPAERKGGIYVSFFFSAGVSVLYSGARFVVTPFLSTNHKNHVAPLLIAVIPEIAACLLQ